MEDEITIIEEPEVEKVLVCTQIYAGVPIMYEWMTKEEGIRKIKQMLGRQGINTEGEDDAIQED